MLFFDLCSFPIIMCHCCRFVLVRLYSSSLFAFSIFIFPAVIVFDTSPYSEAKHVHYVIHRVLLCKCAADMAKSKDRTYFIGAHFCHKNIALLFHFHFRFLCFPEWKVPLVPLRFLLQRLCFVFIPFVCLMVAVRSFHILLHFSAIRLIKRKMWAIEKKNVTILL